MQPLKSYNRMQMQLASSHAFPEPLLAAMPQLREKPCLGFERKNPALHPVHTVCNRTTALGVSWSVASGTRQSDMMGRFMSPDWSAKVEPVPYAKLGNPQSLNLYSYVWNNPLSRNDPDGHYTCADGAKCDSANDKAFQGRLDNLKAAQGTFKEGSKEYKQIGKILSAYGGAGDTKTANGKTVSIGFSGGANTGGVTRSIDKGTIGVSLASNFSEQASGNNVGSTVLVGHEGQHVVDGAPSGTARFGSEMRAESASQTILQGLSGTSVMPSDMESFSIRGVTTWQRGGDSELGGAAYNPGAAFRIAAQDYREDVQNDPK